MLCQNVTIFYQQELASLYQAREKLKFIGDDSHVRIVRLHVVVFTEHDILHF